MNRQPSSGRRVAFFGGSFDPPHLGHLGIARAARLALGLDSVLFAPVGAQPLKPHGATAGFEDRVAMTQLAIADEAAFAVSLADAPKATGEPNFTLDALLALRDSLPPGSELFCLMGADSLAAFRRWHRAAEIPFVASLIVASRPGEQLDDLISAALPEGLALQSPPESVDSPSTVALQRCWLCNAVGEQAQLYLLPELEIEISASQIRSQIFSSLEGNAKERELLPGSVLEYIRTHGLYR